MVGVGCVVGVGVVFCVSVGRVGSSNRVISRGRVCSWDMVYFIVRLVLFSYRYRLGFLL